MRLLKRLLPLAGALLALGGCHKADLLNAFIPRDGYTVYRDVAYGPLASQKADIYVPVTPDEAHTVIVYFYGGSWRSGDKELYRFLGQAMASKGYTTVIPNYRLWPEVYYPDFMHDAANAVAWVHAHIRDYGADPEHLYLMGHSAGAHIAAMLSLNESFLKAAGGSGEWIRGTIGLAGPYDFLPMTDPDVIAVFSKVPDKASQPITYVHSKAPPMMLATGDADDEVAPKNTYNLSRALRAQHNDVVMHQYRDVGHIGIVLALADIFRRRAPVLNDIDAFIKKHQESHHNNDGQAR